MKLRKYSIHYQNVSTLAVAFAGAVEFVAEAGAVLFLAAVPGAASSFSAVGFLLFFAESLLSGPRFLYVSAVKVPTASKSGLNTFRPLSS